MTTPDPQQPTGPSLQKPNPGYAAPPPGGYAPAPGAAVPPAGPPPGGYGMQPPGATAGWGAPPVATVRTVNPVAGIFGALLVAVVGGAIWALLLDYAHFTFALIAILIGSLTGALLSVSLGKHAGSGIIAAVLTAIACLAGEVVGAYAYDARDNQISISEAHRLVPVGTVLSNVSPVSYLFVVVGVVFAFLAGMGQRNRFNGGGRTRRRI